MEQLSKVLGVDAGGSSVKLALVDQSKKVLHHTTVTNVKTNDRNAFLDRWASGIHEFLSQTPPDELRGIGVGIPGILDGERSTVVQSPNIPVLDGFDLKKFFQKEFALPVCLENDVNALAWGEYVLFWRGKVKNMIVAAVGTGIGGGIIIDGHLYLGQGNAGEVGHMPVYADGKACGCGARGCWERYGSTTALLENAREQVARLREALPGSWPDFWREHPEYVENLGSVNGFVLEEAAGAGDDLARGAFAELGKNLGIGCAALGNIFHPEAIVIGGGILPARKHFWPALEQSFRERSMETIADSVVLSPITPGNTGARACALLCHDA
jgi:glucokinase